MGTDGLASILGLHPWPGCGWNEFPRMSLQVALGSLSRSVCLGAAFVSLTHGKKLSHSPLAPDLFKGLPQLTRRAPRMYNLSFLKIIRVVSMRGLLGDWGRNSMFVEILGDC